MHTTLRVVVADDERAARLSLVALLEGLDEVVVVGAAASGDEALSLIERERPDLVLLDVQMPELDGFGVVHLLGGAQTPLIVFVSAFVEYAELALEVGAFGYLLKPTDAKQLRETLARARRQLSDQSFGSRRTPATNRSPD